ncbi:hypothetical protein ABZV15_08060 [Streptomyces sp. NPDC005246]|uniref:hypothetical protein n=1 Tax=Streptomyces sp. NPDC005246 TaxID=3156716 RepID=UPI0033A09912
MDKTLSHESLMDGARKFAHLALEAHRDGDEEVFVLHAGVSFERLMKAALAHANPMLLMEPGVHKEPWLLRFAGVTPVKAPKKDSDLDRPLRTISASQALALTRTAGWLSQHDELDKLIELRNGVAHLGHSKSESSDILAIFARATNQLLDHLHHAQYEYWVDWKPVIEISINDRMEKLEREVRRQVEQARHRYQEQVSKLPDSAVSALQAESYTFPQSLRDSLRGVDLTLGKALCPACLNQAVVAFKGKSFELGEREQREAAFMTLGCMVCQLSLKGLTALGIADVDLMETDIPGVEYPIFEDIFAEISLDEVTAVDYNQWPLDEMAEAVEEDEPLIMAPPSEPE